MYHGYVFVFHTRSTRTRTHTRGKHFAAAVKDLFMVAVMDEIAHTWWWRWLFTPGWPQHHKHTHTHARTHVRSHIVRQSVIAIINPQWWKYKKN